MSREMWLNDEIRDVLAGLAVTVGRLPVSEEYWTAWTDCLATVAVSLGIEVEGGIARDRKVPVLREGDRVGDERQRLRIRGYEGEG